MKKTALAATVVIVIALGVLHGIYAEGSGVIEGAAAVRQLNGGNAEYIASRAVSRGALLPVLNRVGVALIVGFWLTAILWKNGQQVQPE